ncbi:MAG: hypothetical protein ACLQRH_19885 [Acidimicrobiales bacterium]
MPPGALPHLPGGRVRGAAGRDERFGCWGVVGQEVQRRWAKIT